jgi:tmRNA-binding protein
MIYLDGECWLLGVHIAEYAGCGSKFQHPPKRARKLLLSRKEVSNMNFVVMYSQYIL